MMLLSIIGFTLGVSSLSFFSKLPNLLYCIITLVILIIITFLVHKKWKLYFVFLLFFCLGFAWTVYREASLLSWHLPKPLIAQTVSAEGVIVSLPNENKMGARFRFQLTRLNGKPTHSIVRLSWYNHYPVLLAGDHWHLTVRLKPPHGLLNPRSFDYPRWLLQQGIRATGYVVSRGHNQLLQRSHGFSILRLRQHILLSIQKSLKNPELIAVLTALTVGSRSLMNTQQYQIFQRTGTSHLVAISGLHIGLIALFIYGFIHFIWRLFPKLLLRIPSPRAAAIAAILAALIYGALAGFSLPTQRAVIMIAVLMSAQFLLRATPVWRRLLLAFAVVIACQPMAILSASFWLSFIAVGAIMFGMGARLGRSKGIMQWGRMQWIVFIGLLPVTLFFFQKLSLVMLIANVVAIPWMSMIVVPLCLLACLALLISTKLGLWIFGLAGKILWPLWWLLQWLAHSPWVVWQHSIASLWILILGLGAAALCLAPKGLPGRWLAVFWGLPLFFYHPPHPPLGSVWLRVLDVGQGLSTVVRTAHHVLVYDTGPRSALGNFDAGAWVVVPFLHYLGVSYVDKVMISHGDNDHIGGAKSILAAFKVGEILTSVPERFSHHQAFHCLAGQNWQWDGVEFRVLYPPVGQNYQGNNSSCVLSITAGSHALLLPGDLQKQGESWLLQHIHQGLKADVLLAPHHGSKTSSTLPFVQAVQPKIVIFSTGFYNRYGFPSPSVWQRYQTWGAKLLNTAATGAVSVHIPSYGRIEFSDVAENRHYWRD